MSTPEESAEEILKKKLYLQDIGTSLKDFKEVKKNDKNYFILGCGNFGYAEKMMGKDNKYYAVKKLDKYSKKFNKRDFKRETQISIKLNHENLIRFYGYFEDKEKIEKFKKVKLELIEKNNNKFKEDVESIRNSTQDKVIYCLVTEFAQNGSLEDYIKEYKKNCKAKEKHFVPLDQKIVIKFMEQILSALKYLHRKKIAHRDIKPDNILLDENNNIKVADFGIAAIFQEEGDTETGQNDEDLLSHCTTVGRRDFTCPEIENNKKYDYRCDIYSLGLTILSMMFEKRPVEFIDDPINRKIKHRKFKDGIWNNLDNLKCYNEYLIKLIKRMLEENINFRPTSSQCYDELQYIKQIIKNPNDEDAKSFLDNKNNPAKKTSNEMKVIVKNLNDNGIKKMQTQQYNQVNNNNMRNIMNNNMNNMNNIMNNNNNNINNNIYKRGYSYDYTYLNPLNPTYFYPQPYNMNYPNYNQNNVMNYYYTELNNQNFSKNSSIASVIQCLRYCFKDFDLQNFYFFTQEKKLLSYYIEQLIEKVSIEKQLIFLNSIQNFRNNASIMIPNYYFGTEEIEPILAFYGICSYINKEFREQNNQFPNSIYQNFKEMEEVPKEKFPNVYTTIENFQKDYHSPFVDKFYYILLNLIKCPKCNSVLNAEIKDNYGVSSFIPLPGLLIDKVSNLLELYMSKQFDSPFIYNCKNCDYKGPGKDEVGFLNNPNYLLFDFEGEKEIKTLDDSIDLTNYNLSNSKKTKYNLLSFITKENYKFRAYIKNEKHEWCAFNEQNIMEEDFLIIKNNCIPYIAIYKKE